MIFIINNFCIKKKVKISEEILRKIKESVCDRLFIRRCQQILMNSRLQHFSIYNSQKI